MPASCTGSGCVPRPSSKASTSPRCSPPRSARSPPPPQPWMVITGRVPLLLLLGLVPLVLRPEAGTVRLWLLVVAVLILADVLLAPRLRNLAITRTPVGVVRMGYESESALLVENTGRRRARGRVRDAWQPTAGATGN